MAPPLCFFNFMVNSKLNNKKNGYQLILILILIFVSTTTINAQKERTLTLDIVTTPAMVFIPFYSNLPNYLIETSAKTELIGLNIEWVKQEKSMNQGFLHSFFTYGASFRAFGLNWRKDPFNHARENDIKARDIAYINLFMGGKFIVRGFERGALNFNVGPGLLMGPAVQNDNVKDGVFMTLGLDMSMTFSYDLSNR